MFGEAYWRGYVNYSFDKLSDFDLRMGIVTPLELSPRQTIARVEGRALSLCN
jgi:hypothetical protein